MHPPTHPSIHIHHPSTHPLSIIHLPIHPSGGRIIVNVLHLERRLAFFSCNGSSLLLDGVQTSQSDRQCSLWFILAYCPDLIPCHPSTLALQAPHKEFISFPSRSPSESFQFSSQYNPIIRYCLDHPQTLVVSYRKGRSEKGRGEERLGK